MLPTKRAWWWNDVTDADLICETLHWGQKIQWTPRWERGHPERRLPDRRTWSYSEWGNHFADSLAGEVWNHDPTHYRSNPCDPILPHVQSLQVHLLDGTISGKSSKYPFDHQHKIGHPATCALYPLLGGADQPH